ncbi:MAG: Lpg1974 family pore-forming outer membrane protein [Pseudomonadota bacterium]
MSRLPACRTRERARDRLLCSTSALAVVLCLAADVEPVRAEDAQFIFEIDGGWVFGDDQPWARRAPSAEILDIGPEEIFGGTVGLIAPIPASPWEVGVFARFGRTGEESQSRYDPFLFNVIGGYYPTAYVNGSVEHQEDHLIVDFEARRDVGLGSEIGTKSVLSAGLRFGYFSADTKTQFLYPPPIPIFPAFVFEENREDVFVGVGPHVGIETSTPLTGGLSFDLAASASVLFGPRVTSVIASGSLPFVAAGFSEYEFDAVPMLEGRIGLSYVPQTQRYRLSAGVDASAWFDVFNQLTTVDILGSPPGDENADRFLLRPYVRLTVPLGGTLDGPSAESTSLLSSEPASLAVSMSTIVEVEAGVGNMGRSGDALNQTTNPSDEVDDFGFFGGKLLAAVPVRDNLLIQGEIHGEATFGNDTSDGAPSSDSYDSSHLFGGQIAFDFGPLTFAAFGAAGGTDILSRPGSTSHDSTNRLFGVSGRYLNEFGSFAVQVGTINTTADDPETIDEALFARLIGQVFLHGGRTMVQGEFAYATGEQDNDSVFVGPNPVELMTWGAEIEHQLPIEYAGGSASMFLAYRGVRVLEQSLTGTTDELVDQGVFGGIRVRLGSVTPFDREAATAPDLPNIGYWVGAVPAVD